MKATPPIRLMLLNGEKGDPGHAWQEIAAYGTRMPGVAEHRMDDRRVHRRGWLAQAADCRISVGLPKRVSSLVRRRPAENRVLNPSKVLS